MTDDKEGIIMEAEVTLAQPNECKWLLRYLKGLSKAAIRRLAQLTADSAYAAGYLFAWLEKQQVDAVIPTKALAVHHKAIPLYRFKYDAKNHLVRCPRGKHLRRSNQAGHGWFYKSRTRDCRHCSVRERCLSPTVGRRTVFIVHGYDALLRARRRHGNWDNSWRDLYKRHRWQVEGVHGEAKTQHGLGRAVRRGLDNVAIQALMSAIAINLKRLARWQHLIYRLLQRLLDDVCHVPMITSSSQALRYL